MKYHNPQMRCIFSFIIVFLMVLSLTSCKENTEVDNSSSEITVSESETNSNEITEETESEESLTEENVSAPAESEPNTNDVPVHTHSYTKKVVSPACVQNGYTTYTCTCGHTYQDNFVNQLGHSFGEWVIIVEATTSSVGTQEHKCTRCGCIETSEMPKKISSATIAPGVTITKIFGNTKYELDKCSVIDMRKWGEPPTIVIVDNNSLHVTYYDKNNEQIEFVATQPFSNDWINLYSILDDGTWGNRLIGAYS